MRNREEYVFIESTAELEALVPRWQQLWRRDPAATPFQSPAWLVPWWHQFGQPQLRVVAIERDETLIGLLPFYIYCEPVCQTRQLLPLGIGTTDYLDGIFAPECEDAAIARAVEILFESTTEWDEMVVPQLRPGSRLLPALLAASASRGTRFAAESCSVMPALRCGDLPQKIRRNAMYYRNRAQRLGRLEYMVADVSTWPEVFSVLERLHSERWRERGESGVLADPRVLAWHREALPRLHDEDLLRLGVLQLNDEPLGVVYSLIDRPGRGSRTQFFYITAFSIEHAELRPGTLLLAYAIDHAAQEGVAVIDMLCGEESYKQIWHLERVPTDGFRMRREDLVARGTFAA